jgi:hypothetical protein
MRSHVASNLQLDLIALHSPPPTAAQLSAPSSYPPNPSFFSRPHPRRSSTAAFAAGAAHVTSVLRSPPTPSVQHSHCSPSSSPSLKCCIVCSSLPRATALPPFRPSRFASKSPSIPPCWPVCCVLPACAYSPSLARHSCHTSQMSHVTRSQVHMPSCCLDNHDIYPPITVFEGSSNSISSSSRCTLIRSHPPSFPTHFSVLVLLFIVFNTSLEFQSLL